MQCGVALLHRLRRQHCTSGRRRAQISSRFHKSVNPVVSVLGPSPIDRLADEIEECVAFCSISVTPFHSSVPKGLRVGAAGIKSKNQSGAPCPIVFVVERSLPALESASVQGRRAPISVGGNTFGQAFKMHVGRARVILNH